MGICQERGFHKAKNTKRFKCPFCKKFPLFFCADCKRLRFSVWCFYECFNPVKCKYCLGLGVEEGKDCRNGHRFIYLSLPSPVISVFYSEGIEILGGTL